MTEHQDSLILNLFWKNPKRVMYYKVSCLRLVIADFKKSYRIGYMNSRIVKVVIGVFFWSSLWVLSSLYADDNTPSGSFAVEKANALRNPYADDGGPRTLDVSAYPPEMQKIYRELFIPKCSRCHTAARPINSSFVEPSGSSEEKRTKITRWQKEQPELFKNPQIWTVDERLWNQYVKRMKLKAGADLTLEDAKSIWKFLCYDSEKRKTGASAKKWAEHRRQLLADFKASHPDRYHELYGLE